MPTSFRRRLVDRVDLLPIALGNHFAIHFYFLKLIDASDLRRKIISQHGDFPYLLVNFEAPIDARDLRPECRVNYFVGPIFYITFQRFGNP